jgi:hypothetical protein
MLLFPLQSDLKTKMSKPPETIQYNEVPEADNSGNIKFGDYVDEELRWALTIEDLKELGIE